MIAKSIGPFGADIVAAMVRGYLACAEWADKPEGSNARIPASQHPAAHAVVRAFLQVSEPLMLQALQVRDADHLGHDLWLTRGGHGTGFWDRPELEVAPCTVLTVRDRDDKPYLSSERGETLGDALSAIAYGTAGAISPFAYPSLTAFRGWLYFDDFNACPPAGYVPPWAFWQAWHEMNKGA